MCDMCSSSFSQAGVLPETAGESPFWQSSRFFYCLIAFPEFLSHKKLSDARRGTWNNVARSAWLSTLQIALTDV